MDETETGRLRREVEDIVGGTVIALDRQPRWRKAWFASVQRRGETLPIYVRGDKQIDAEPYPGLDREAAILRLFEAGGLPVPHVHGMTSDPIGIVMDRVPGSRDMTEAADDNERRRLAEEYIGLLARMHRLDTAPFVAVGVVQPVGAKAIALSYLDAHEHLYARTKRGAQPLVEWALRWIRRNVPLHRDFACVVHGDPGQFLFADGRLTCIYDFEATHIGDPLHDLAALRVRHGTEPLGADVDHLIAHYARVSGTPVDLPVLSFHTAAFMLAAVLALAGPLSDPKPADMQLEYLIWDLMTRRAMLWAMAECMGTPIQPVVSPVPPDTRSSRTQRVLEATLGRIEPGSATGAADLASARTLAEWAQSSAVFGMAREQADLDRVAKILGARPHDWHEADIALERFVATAGADQDAALFAYFAAQTEDLVAEALPVQSRLAHYALKPVRL